MSNIPIRYNNYFTGTGTGNTWQVDIKPCIRKPQTYHEELLTNARIIKDLSDGKIYLMYSGGIDSEYILHIFLGLGIKIAPVIVKLNPNYNDYDFSFAIKYCEDNNLKPIVVDLDFDKFVTGGKFKEIADKSGTPVYQYPALFDVMQRLDRGVIILGSDEPHFVRQKENESVWLYDEMERIYSVSRWFELTGLNGTPAFLNWSAETLLAYQNIKEVKSLFYGRWPGRMGNNFLKQHIYQLPTRDKKDGYEIIRQSKIFQHPDIQAIVSDPMDYNVKNNGYWSIEQQKLKSLLESKL